MSLAVFLMTMIEDENGEQLRFDRSIVEQAFASFTLDQDTDNWRLLTPDGKLCLATLSVDVDRKITGFSIDGALTMPTFWDATYEVLRQTPTIVVWPGRDPSYCVAQLDYEKFVPADYIESFGPPVIVNCGVAILATLDASV